jgi:hypothetical protein
MQPGKETATATATKKECGQVPTFLARLHASTSKRMDTSLNA